MGYLEKLKKEPRIVLSVLNFIFLLLPWLSVSSSFELFGYTEEVQALSYTGFRLVNGSLIMVLLLLIPILFIAMGFLSNLQKYRKIIYLIGSAIAILLMVIESFRLGLSLGSGVNELGVKISVNRGIGFWLTLLSYLGIIVATLVLDYKMSKDVLKEKGLKGAFSEVADQVTNTASEMAGSIKNMNISLPVNNTAETKEASTQAVQAPTVICSSCSEEVPLGTAFCSKCGAKMNEIKKCSNCETELTEGSDFCSECGTKVE